MRTQLSEAGRIRLLSIAAFLSIIKRTNFDPNKLSVIYDQFLNLKVGSTEQITTIAFAILRKQPKIEMAELLTAISATPKIKQEKQEKQKHEEAKKQQEVSEKAEKEKKKEQLEEEKKL